MRFVLSFLSFFVLAAASVTRVSGQIAPGQSGTSSLVYIDEAEAMITLTIFGRCYAKKNRNEALSVIATQPGSREEMQTLRKLFRRSNIACMSNNTNLRMPLPYIRGVIAEGLLRSGSAIPASHVLPALPAIKVRNLSDAAGCYVAGHEDEVRKLLMTKVGSKPEFESVSAIADDFVNCLPVDRSRPLYTTLIRFRLAEALLRVRPNMAVTSGT